MCIMMKIKYLSKVALNDLRINFKNHLKYYLRQDYKWFDDYLNQSGYVLESKIEFDNPNLITKGDYTVHDPTNVKRLYNSLKHLTEAQATQECLWAGLALLQLRDYTFYRIKKDIDDKNDKRIESSIFFAHGTRRSLFAHVLSRLWWVAHLTYDPNNKKDPFWLTDIFTESEFGSRTIYFFSSIFTSNRNITRGILRAFHEFKNRGIKIKRKYYLEANRYLNIIGGARILDLFSEEEIMKMVYDHLNNHFRLSKNKKYFFIGI